MADFTIKVAPASRKKAISGYDMFKQDMVLQSSEMSSTASKGKPNDLQNFMAKYAEAWKALKKDNPNKINQVISRKPQRRPRLGMPSPLSLEEDSKSTIMF